jgi:hypothetical protein
MKVANLNDLMSLLLVVMLTSLAILMLPIEMMAGPVGKDAAKQKALAFLNGRAASRAGARAASVQELRLEYTSDAYHIFNCGEKGGFVIVGGDDCAPEILGYADSGTFNWQNMPDNLRAWMKGYEEDIKILCASGIKYSTNENAGRTRGSGCKTSIAPLLTSKWNQDYPYNMYTPMGYNEDEKQNVHCVTGCLATALAQVMYYWSKKGFVSQLLQDIPPFTPDDNNCPALDGLSAPESFDWTNMVDTYDMNTTDAAKQAVAKLMKYTGYALKMKYGAKTSEAYFQYVHETFRNYFGYKSAIWLKRNLFSYDQWADIIYNELSLGRPVYYHGTSSGGGHAFVCDGYDKEDYYHINWGWGGNCDGNFRLQLMNPDNQGIGGSSTEDGYSMYQGVIVCHPTEDIVISPMTSYNQISNDIECKSIKESTLEAGRTSNVRVILKNNNSQWPFSDDVIVRLSTTNNELNCLIGFNVELEPGETKEVTFPLPIPKNLSGQGTLSIYKTNVDNLDNNLLKEEEVNVSPLQTISGNVTIYRDGNTLWYHVDGNAAGLDHSNFTVKWFDYLTFKVKSTLDTYELQADDRGKTIAVTIESPYYLGKLTSSGYDCYGLVNPIEPTVPNLGISQNMVYVANAQADQEYIIFDFQKPIITLAESDWKIAKRPTSDGEALYMGGTNSSVNYVYTRKRASGQYIAGDNVVRSSIYLGDETKVIRGISLKVELQTFVSASKPKYTELKAENGAYYVKYGDVVRIKASPIPSTATFYGIAKDRWVNNAMGGKFYSDYKCNFELEDNTSYETVYYKAEKQMNYNEIIAEYVSGGPNSVYTDKFYLHVAYEDGFVLMTRFDQPSVTIGEGEKRSEIPITTYPLKATLSSTYAIVANSISSEGQEPTVTFDDETHSISVDATNATAGTYFYEVWQKGVKQSNKIQVEVTTPPIESVEILGDGIQTERGSTIQMKMLLTPANAKAKKVEWSVEDESIATINSEGVLTIKADAPRGIWATIRVKVNDMYEDECDLIVPKLTPQLWYDDWGYMAFLNAPFTPPTLNNPLGLNIRYTSSNMEVATVDQTTGVVTLKAPGTAIISASFMGNDEYNYGEAWYVLGVSEPQKGDANSDGKVDAEDIKAVVDYIVKGKKNGFNFDNANLNGDTKVDAADLVLLINKVNNP